MDVELNTDEIEASLANTDEMVTSQEPEAAAVRACDNEIEINEFNCDTECLYEYRNSVSVVLLIIFCYS